MNRYRKTTHFVSEKEAREFYSQLCWIYNGSENRVKMHLATLGSISVKASVPLDRAEELCDAMLRYGITNIHDRMIVI